MKKILLMHLIAARIAGHGSVKDPIIKPPRMPTDAEIKAKQLEHMASGRSMLLETLVQNPMSWWLKAKPQEAMNTLFGLMPVEWNYPPKPEVKV